MRQESKRQEDTDGDRSERRDQHGTRSGILCRLRERMTLRGNEVDQRFERSVHGLKSQHERDRERQDRKCRQARMQQPKDDERGDREHHLNAKVALRAPGVRDSLERIP